MSRKTRSLLAAARVANLPGVACHAATGGFLAWGFAAGARPAAIPWWWIVLAALAGVLLCVAGNLLNDWHDRDWDRLRRPERALPSGRFSPAVFLTTGIVCLVAGVGLMFASGSAAGAVALAIAVCIAIYTRWHKRAVWTVVPLALCRGLLPWMGALAVRPDAHAWLSASAAGTALFLWVCGLSLDARGESTGRGRHLRLAWILILAAPLVATGIFWIRDSVFPWFGLLPAALWLAVVRGPLRHTAKQRVSALLGGLPLVDFATLAGLWTIMPGVPLAVLAMPLAAFAVGLALQRMATAT